MATITVRAIDEDLKARLRVQAAQHGRSMEEEVRQILRQALDHPQAGGRLGTRILERFATVDGDVWVDLERTEPPRGASFEP